MVISVSAFARDEMVRRAIARSDAVRRETLRRCYDTPGYAELTREEKNRYYDAIKAEVETEVTE